MTDFAKADEILCIVGEQSIEGREHTQERQEKETDKYSRKSIHHS